MGDGVTAPPLPENGVDRERHYFSNGTEHEIWAANWCYRCTWDHDFSHGAEFGDAEQGCNLILAMVLGWNAPELVRVEAQSFSNPDLLVSSLECMAFHRCLCDRGPDDPPGEPLPPEPDPNQGAMFDVAETPVGIVWRADPREFMDNNVEVLR